MVFAVSPEDTYVFFCEGKVDPLQCVPFVFDSRSQMIYPVTQNTESQPLSRATAASIGWVDGQLSLPGFTSVTAEKPWLLLGQN